MKDKEEDYSIFKCEECGVEFSNIFEYLREHDTDFKALLPIGNIKIDLMDVLKELYELILEKDLNSIKNITTGIGSVLYAHANGFLKEMVDEIIIEETVEKEVENLDAEIKKFFRREGKSE